MAFFLLSPFYSYRRVYPKDLVPALLHISISGEKYSSSVAEGATINYALASSLNASKQVLISHPATSDMFALAQGEAARGLCRNRF